MVDRPAPPDEPLLEHRLTTGRERVAADAAARGIDIEFVERLNAGSLAEAASILGISEGDVVKSLVVKRSDDTFLFALIPGDRQIAWAKLRSVVGVNKLQLPSQDIAFEATGYERGTITPLGSTTSWPVFADETIRGKRIALGAGEHGLSVFVQADDLIVGLDASVADISD